ncbi:hypothetical protein WJ64_32720 [Burkholderia ubonensis]|nr:hypothetical protein WJ64_32720 [Burkholderia ubonensis]
MRRCHIVWLHVMMQAWAISAAFTGCAQSTLRCRMQYFAGAHRADRRIAVRLATRLLASCLHSRVRYQATFDILPARPRHVQRRAQQ